MNNSIDKNAIRMALKNRRIEKGLTMKEVASKVGVSEGTISRWESGNIENMRRDKISKLADALDISPSEIMGWDDNWKDSPDHFHIPVLGHVAAGIPLDMISRRLGHANSKITREVYYHITEKMKEKENEMLKEIKIC